jgi:transcriptional regulator with XRE-family HTH domain
MGRSTLEQDIVDRRRLHRRAVGEALRRVREDAGLSIREVARAAGIDHAHLSRIEHGHASASQDTLVAVARIMGHAVSIRLYPTDGPRLRDHVQARMLDAVLGIAHPRWRSRLEVAVYRPAHGVIDLVLEDREHPDIVAGEGHSQLRSVEAQLRWANDKTASLLSAPGWPWREDGVQPHIDRLLLLRSCRAMHETVLALPHLFRAAYPARPGDAYEALTTSGPRWPGSAILWVTVDGADTRVLRGLPTRLRGSW